MSDLIDRKRILLVGGATILAAVIANLIARAILMALLPIDPAFPPFSVGAIALLTALFTGIGVGVFALIARFAKQPYRVFLVVAVIAFAVSIIPNLVSAADPTAIPFPFPGASSTAFLALIVLHVVPAAIAIGMLSTLTRTQEPSARNP